MRFNQISGFSQSWLQKPACHIFLQMLPSAVSMRTAHCIKRNNIVSVAVIVLYSKAQSTNLLIAEIGLPF